MCDATWWSRSVAYGVAVPRFVPRVPPGPVSSAARRESDQLRLAAQQENIDKTLASTARERGRMSKKARKAAAAEAPPPDISHVELEALVSRLLDAPARNAARASIVAIGRNATPYLLTRMKDPNFTIR